MNTCLLTPVRDSPDDLAALTVDTDVVVLWQLGFVVASRCVFHADEYRRSWRAVQFLADLFWRQ